MTSQYRGSRRKKGGVSTTKTTSQNRSSGTAAIAKKKEFRYQLHDSGSRGNGYTFEKITQAIILKIQTTFNGGRYIVTSLRSRVKQGPPMPT